MKKLSQPTKPNLKNLERSLIQDLSEQQASALTGGTKLKAKSPEPLPVWAFALMF